MSRRGFTIENAKDLYADVVKLSSDYWILEGSFSGNALFIAAKISNENILEMENDAICLINSLTEKARSATSIDGNDDLKFKQVKGSLMQLIEALSELRMKLEGPTWYNYATDNVHYQLIGNQPNPGQTGSPAPKRRKPTRSTKPTVKAHKSSVDSMASGTRDDAAESLVALASSSKGNSAAHSFYNTDAPATPSPLAAPPANRRPAPLDFHVGLDNFDQKEQEIAQLRALSTKSRTDFATAINYFQNENIRLEKKVQDMISSQNLQIAEKNRVIIEKDRVIAHQDMLIRRHKTALLPQGIQIDDKNGEILFGSIGKRGFVEDREADRIQELKKQKTSLYDEVQILSTKRNELSAQIKELKSTDKSVDQSEEIKNGVLSEDAGMNSESMVGYVEEKTSVMAENATEETET